MGIQLNEYLKRTNQTLGSWLKGIGATTIIDVNEALKNLGFEPIDKKMTADITNMLVPEERWLFDDENALGLLKLIETEQAGESTSFQKRKKKTKMTLDK
jgi:hypothetical protein